MNGPRRWTDIESGTQVGIEARAAELFRTVTPEPNQNELRLRAFRRFERRRKRPAPLVGFAIFIAASGALAAALVLWSDLRAGAAPPVQARLIETEGLLERGAHDEAVSLLAETEAATIRERLWRADLLLESGQPELARIEFRAAREQAVVEALKERAAFGEVISLFRLGKIDEAKSALERYVGDFSAPER